MLLRTPRLALLFVFFLLALSLAASASPPPDLYVANDMTPGSVLHFNGTTGAAIGSFPAGSAPAGLAFGPDGGLYIAIFAGNDVLRYDPTAGTTSVFVAPGTGVTGKVTLAGAAASDTTIALSAVSVASSSVSVASSSVSVASSSVTGGTGATGTVTLTGTAASAVVVTLTSNSASVTLSAPTVTVPAGASTATFPVSTVAVAKTTTVIVPAASGPVKKMATLTVTH